jgi:hypothetical protein
MNDQDAKANAKADAKAFIAALAQKLSPKQRAEAWARLTPKECATAFAAMTPPEREADASALDEAYIEEDGISDYTKQRRKEIVERNKDLIRKGLLVDYGRRDGMAVLVATKYLTAGGVFTGYEPNSSNPLQSKREQTHDFHGNEPEGQYWDWTEQSFEQHAEAFRAAGNERAAAIADQLIATTDNMPAEVMAEFQGFWNRCGDLRDDDDDDDDDDNDLEDDPADAPAEGHDLAEDANKLAEDAAALAALDVALTQMGIAPDANAATAPRRAPAGLGAALTEMNIALGKLLEIDNQMMDEIGRGEFTPDDATAYALEFIRRASGIKPT